MSFAFALAACCGDAALAGTASHRRRRVAAPRSGSGTGPVPAPSAEVVAVVGITATEHRSKEDTRETARAADAAARLARCTICIDPTSALIVALPLI